MPSKQPSKTKAKTKAAPCKSGHAWCLQGLVGSTHHAAGIPYADIAADAKEAINELDAAGLVCRPD